jgi:type IV pilus assembly protein PilE
MARTGGKLMNNTRGNSGFTLIELMIVVVIIAILAAVALPSYRGYIMRGHRTDATRALQDVAAREESYFFSNNSYTDKLSDLGLNSTVAGEYFSVTIASASSSDYTITATARGTQAQDTDCTSFSLTRAGEQGATGSATPTKCWGK